MTTKSTAKLAVLGNPQCNTEEDFDLFTDHLARWCAQWVPEIAVPIMRKADVLYDNAAVCILLGKWTSNKRQSVADTHERLLRAATGEEFECESEGSEFEFSESVYRREAGSYSDALYALLVQ